MRKNRVNKICEYCDKSFEVIRSREKAARFCSRSCHGKTIFGDPDIQKRIKHPSGPANHKWKGGRRKHTNGYIWVLIDGQYILEHRHIMEKFLKRKLLHGEHVHHKNGKKLDNRIKNLELTNVSKHTKDHWKEGIDFQYNSKLSKKERAKIFRLYNTGLFSHKKLGKLFRVTKTTIGDLIRRKTWKNDTLK